MGLITRKMEITLIPKTITYYENLGYIIPKYKDNHYRWCVKNGTRLKIKVEDLLDGSEEKVDVQCDGCGRIKPMGWCEYKLYVHKDGKCYCSKCAINLYGTERHKQSKLKNGTSFEQWCVENDKQEILNRWDYELNKCKPNEITYGTDSKKYWFKCPNGLHPSELKNINSFTNGCEGTMNCKMCNSFATWGITNIGEDFLEKYWDYEKNKVNPWEISCGCNRPKIFIKCQEKLYHGSYDISCGNFVIGRRCPYCNPFASHGKIHPLDSLGKLLEDKGILWIWSNKNKKSPYEYALFSCKEVWWKCENGKHKDYLRDIGHSNRYNFRCPECDFSEGEKKIEEYLMQNNILYIPQKEFDGLIGLGNGNLSYDFYLQEYNFLIEYQGIQHEKPVNFLNEGIKKVKENFKKQQEHDKRKCEYAKEHNIKLLEIWYWDFDNIKQILDKELKINKQF